ncbi:unnamed protein product [Protopolystoma xenopodis]|uniref:Uncharacterized protein n=1 Tax=Protopolystoma xenopodis TaxID=117903 RepID=A0A448WB76_9PLAT|nr:unnamed protein product [Protopolystoma xenopodis]
MERHDKGSAWLNSLFPTSPSGLATPVCYLPGSSSAELECPESAPLLSPKPLGIGQCKLASSSTAPNRQMTPNSASCSRLPVNRFPPTTTGLPTNPASAPVTTLLLNTTLGGRLFDLNVNHFAAPATLPQHSLNTISEAGVSSTFLSRELANRRQQPDAHTLQGLGIGNFPHGRLDPFQTREVKFGSGATLPLSVTFPFSPTGLTNSYPPNSGQSLRMSPTLFPDLTEQSSAMPVAHFSQTPLFPPRVGPSPLSLAMPLSMSLASTIQTTRLSSLSPSTAQTPIHTPTTTPMPSPSATPTPCLQIMPGCQVPVRWSGLASDRQNEPNSMRFAAQMSGQPLGGLLCQQAIATYLQLMAALQPQTNVKSPDNSLQTHWAHPSWRMKQTRAIREGVNGDMCTCNQLICLTSGAGEVCSHCSGTPSHGNSLYLPEMQTSLEIESQMQASSCDDVEVTQMSNGNCLETSNDESHIIKKQTSSHQFSGSFTSPTAGTTCPISSLPSFLSTTVISATDTTPTAGPISSGQKSISILSDLSGNVRQEFSSTFGAIKNGPTSFLHFPRTSRKSTRDLEASASKATFDKTNQRYVVRAQATNRQQNQQNNTKSQHHIQQLQQQFLHYQSSAQQNHKRPVASEAHRLGNKSAILSK